MVKALMVAGTHSGVGKTTIALGLMRLFNAAPFKVGPDFIDTGYQAMGSRRVARNLDPFLCGEEGLRQVFAHGTMGADCAIIEGAMGFYDGRVGVQVPAEASSAHVAQILGAPVILVLSARHIGQSLAAMIRGYVMESPVPVVGVIINFVGGAKHEAICRAAAEQAGVPLLGLIPRNAELHVPSRHLGLMTVQENNEAEAYLRACAGLVEKYCDIDTIGTLMREITTDVVSLQPLANKNKKIGIATGRAFSFRYPEWAELCGQEVVEFDPLVEPIPEVDGLYIPGGYPEVHAKYLSSSQATKDLLDKARQGLPIWAECGGLLWLVKDIDGIPMSGVIDAHASMSTLSLGYREAIATQDSVIAPAGARVRAHEFHHSRMTYGQESPAWAMREGVEGFVDGAIYASYLHLHPVGNLAALERFISAL
ncbi:MAG: cobyrinate a,c-diamide synthase [Corynebacterium sp.]|nr:cobyrinate a,c-diamide synthase [Corynebacterium sp.]